MKKPTRLNVERFNNLKYTIEQLPKKTSDKTIAQVFGWSTNTIFYVRKADSYDEYKKLTCRINHKPIEIEPEQKVEPVPEDSSETEIVDVAPVPTTEDTRVHFLREIDHKMNLILAIAEDMHLQYQTKRSGKKFGLFS